MASWAVARKHWAQQLLLPPLMLKQEAEQPVACRLMWLQWAAKLAQRHYSQLKLPVQCLSLPRSHLQVPVHRPLQLQWQALALSLPHHDQEVALLQNSKGW